jgi:hypothetical protein
MSIALVAQYGVVTPLEPHTKTLGMCAVFVL